MRLGLVQRLISALCFFPRIQLQVWLTAQRVATAKILLTLFLPLSFTSSIRPLGNISLCPLQLFRKISFKVRVRTLPDHFLVACVSCTSLWSVRRRRRRSSQRCKQTKETAVNQSLARWCCHPNSACDCWCSSVRQALSNGGKILFPSVGSTIRSSYIKFLSSPCLWHKRKKKKQ